MSATKIVKVFYCCSDSLKDEEMRQKLEDHLKDLERQSIITKWHKGMISPGKEWEAVINAELKTADIILVLISSDFIASDYHWEVVIRQAMQQHRTRQSRVIPILLRPVLNTWKIALDNLPALPTGERPVTSWNPYDNAFANIAEGIKEEAEKLTDPTYHIKTYSRQVWALAIPVMRAVRNIFIYVIKAIWRNLFKKSNYRRYRRINKIPASLIIFAICASAFTFIYQQYQTYVIPSSDIFGGFSSRHDSIDSNYQGWIWLGIVKNRSGRFYVGQPLIIKPEIIEEYPSIIPSRVPSPGDIVTVKNIVKLRKEKYLNSEIIKELQVEEKIVILKVQSVSNFNITSPYTRLMAQVRKCTSNCYR